MAVITKDGKGKTAPKPEVKAAPPPATTKKPATGKGLGFKIHPEQALEALNLLAAYIDERVEAAKDKAKLGNTVGAIKIWDAISKLKDAVAERLKTPLEEAYNTLRFNTVPSFMEDEEITRITVDDVGRVNITDDIRVTVNDKEGLKDWLIEVDKEDLITSVVNAQTLAAFVRGRIKEGLTQDGKGLPKEDIITVTPFVRAAITR